MISDPYQAPGPLIRTIADEDPRAGAALAAVGRASQASAVFSFLEDYLVGRQRSLDRLLFQALEEGQPTTHLVAQKYEAHLFVRNLEKLAKSGEQAAKLLAPLMDREQENERNETSWDGR